MFPLHLNIRCVLAGFDVLLIKDRCRTGFLGLNLERRRNMNKDEIVEAIREAIL